MMETTSYARIKVTDLVQSMNISRSTFYFYFDSVSAVLDEIERDFLEQISAESSSYRLIVRKYHDDSYAAVLVPYLDTIKKNLRIFRIISGPNSRPDFQEKLRQRIVSVYREVYRNVPISPMDQKLLCELLAGGQWYVFRYWANHEDELTEEALCDFLEKFMKSLDTLFVSLSRS